MVLNITDHVICRFRERTKCKKSNTHIKNKIYELLSKAKEAEFSHPKFAIRALFNHNFVPASYLMTNDWVFVIVDNEVRTIHNNEAKRWILKNKKSKKH